MEIRERVFEADGVSLHGLWFVPDGAGPHPIVVMSHGLSGIVAAGLAGYAEPLAEAGISVLAYDHRGWGRSGGWPRCESDPWRQVADMRDAISTARRLPGIDPERLGLWGTSYAGGHVLTVAALDRRVRCVVSQVPLMSGSRTFDAWVPSAKRERFVQRLAEDRDARAAGAPGATVAAAPDGSETAEWIKFVDRDGAYENCLTVRSFDLLRSYEPCDFVPKIAPTPLMMVVAEHDTQTPTAWQLEAFAGAGEPKRLARYDGRHYDVYHGDGLAFSSGAAREWFQEHLQKA